MDPQQAASDLAKLMAAFDDMSAMLAEPLSADHVAAALAGQRAKAQRYGANPDDWATAFERNLVPGPPNGWPLWTISSSTCCIFPAPATPWSPSVRRRSPPS
jgi:hypothetical protein